MVGGTNPTNSLRDLTTTTSGRTDENAAMDILGRPRQHSLSTASSFYGSGPGQPYIPSSLLAAYRDPVISEAAALQVGGQHSNRHSSRNMIMEEKMALMRMIQYPHGNFNSMQATGRSRLLLGMTEDEIALRAMSGGFLGSQQRTTGTTCQSLSSLDSSSKERFMQRFPADPHHGGTTFNRNTSNNVISSRNGGLQPEVLLRQHGYPPSVSASTVVGSHNTAPSTRLGGTSELEAERFLPQPGPPLLQQDRGCFGLPPTSSIRKTPREENKIMLDSQSTSSRKFSLSRPDKGITAHEWVSKNDGARSNCDPKMAAARAGFPSSSSSKRKMSSPSNSTAASNNTEKSESGDESEIIKNRNFGTEEKLHRGQRTTPMSKGKRSQFVQDPEDHKDTTENDSRAHRDRIDEKNHDFAGEECAAHDDFFHSSSAKKRRGPCHGGSFELTQEGNLIAASINSTDTYNSIRPSYGEQQPPNYYYRQLLAESERYRSFLMQHAALTSPLSYHSLCNPHGGTRLMLSTVGSTMLDPAVSAANDSFGVSRGYLAGFTGNPSTQRWSTSNVEERRPEETPSSAFHIQSRDDGNEQGVEEATMLTQDSRSFPLHIGEDENNLSPYQVLARRQIEVFEASSEEAATNAQGRNRPIQPGQIGIRCRHCARLPPKKRSTGAVYYPNKVRSCRGSIVIRKCRVFIRRKK